MGSVASVLILGGCLVLARPGSYVRRDPWWIRALLPLATAGIILAVWWRMDTAAVTGGNIGGGFVDLFGPPGIMGLVVRSLWRIHKERGPST